MDKIPFNKRRDALFRLQKITDKQAEDEIHPPGHLDEGESQWDEYKSDASEYFHVGAWRDRVKAFFDDLHVRGEKVVYLDVCGTADGAGLGADKNYAFSLKTPESVERRPDRVFIEGDVLSRGDIRDLIARLKNEGDDPALITFEPYEGIAQQLHVEPHVSGATLEEEKHKARLAYDRLGDDLRRALEIVRPGGFMLVGHFSASPDYIPELVEKIPEYLAEIAKKANCTMEMDEYDTFLFHKPETASA